MKNNTWQGLNKKTDFPKKILSVSSLIKILHFDPNRSHFRLSIEIVGVISLVFPFQ